MIVGKDHHGILATTIPVEEFQKEDLSEGAQITIKIDKKFDIDAMAQDLFKGKI